MQPEKFTMTVKEAAKLLSISLPTMEKILKRTDFNALLRIGRKKLILKNRFMQWLENAADNDIKDGGSSVKETIK